MYEYKGRHELKNFYTISETCELLGLDTDKLRYRCLLHGIHPATYKGVLGLDMRSFETLKNFLFMEQNSEAIHEEPWS